VNFCLIERKGQKPDKHGLYFLVFIKEKSPNLVIMMKYKQKYKVQTGWERTEVYITNNFVLEMKTTSVTMCVWYI